MCSHLWPLPYLKVSGFLSPRRTFPFAGVSTFYYFFLFAAHSVCLAIHATLCCAANVEQGQKEEVQSAAHRD